MEKDEEKNKAAPRKRRHLNVKTMRGSKHPRRKTGIAQRLTEVEEQGNAKIDDSDVESDYMSDDVKRDDEDWRDEKEVASESEEDRERITERIK